MGGTLLIAEHPGHVAALESAGLTGRPGTSVLALTALAQHALMRNGRDSLTPDDFCAREVINGAGDWVTRLLGVLESKLDPLLIDRLPDLKRLEGAGPVALAWWEVHRLLSPYAAAAAALVRVLDGLRPSCVLCFSGDGLGATVLERRLNSPWPVTLSALAASRGLHIQVIPEPEGWPDRRVSLPLRERVPRWAGAIRSALTALRGVRLLPAHGGGALKGPLLVLGPRGYELPYLLPVVGRRSGSGVWTWNFLSPPVRISPLPRRRLDRPAWTGSLPNPGSLWPEVRTDADLAEAMTFEGVGLARVLAPALEHLCDRIAPELATLTTDAEVVLDRLRPSVVLSEFSHRREHVVQRLAGLRNIPVVEYNHGVGLMASSFETAGAPLAFHRGWRWATRVLAQGPGVVAYMEKWHRVGHKTLPVGSAHLDGFRRASRRPWARKLARAWLGVDDSARVALYVENPGEGAIRQPPHRARSTGQQWILEQHLLGAAGACPDVHLLIKTYPYHQVPWDRTPIEETLQERGPSNCRIVRAPLGALLAGADLLIADTPTFSFFEMLATDLPVVLCGWEMPWPFEPERWHPAITPMWRDRVIYLETLDDLDRRLPEIFRRLPLPRADNATLLREFGTHLDDGDSVERAWRALANLSA